MEIEVQDPTEQSILLEEMAGGMPHVLIVAESAPDGFKVRLEGGGGLTDLATVEALLRKTHAIVQRQMG